MGAPEIFTGYSWIIDMVVVGSFILTGPEGLWRSMNWCIILDCSDLVNFEAKVSKTIFHDSVGEDVKGWGCTVQLAYS